MRKNHFVQLSLKASIVALCSAGALLGASAHAAPADDAAARYRMERDNCMSGRTHQDRTTCLKEAGAAQGEARAGRLADRDASYRQNALERCRVLPVSDREACVGRIDGSGRVSGSVEGGGVIREYTQRIQGTPEPMAAPAPVQPQRTYDGRPSGAVPYGGMPAPSMQPAPMQPAPVYPAPAQPMPRTR
jgi:hypothetical protein